MGKKSSPPPPPDYAALAKQQAELDKSAAQEQTVVNRPDQFTPWGTSDWTEGADGQWSQKITLDPAEQAALDQNREFASQKQGIASGLLDKAGQTLSSPLDLTGLPELKDYDFSNLSDWEGLSTEGLPELADSGFGAVQEVQDAMMGRLAPARQQARDSEIQRLKNQGLSEDSNAFQRALTRLDQGDTDANQQALLAATDAYGDIFDRSLSARGQLFGERGQTAGFNNTMRGQQLDEQSRATQLAGLLRQQKLAEQQTLRQSPLDDFLKLTAGISPGMPQMPSFMAGTGYKAADMYGAGKDQYQAAMDAFNADQAQGAGLMSGLFGLGGAALGAPSGGLLAKVLGL